MADQDKDQKTEQATPQKIRKAYEDGQIGVSADLIGGVMLATGIAFFWLGGTWFFGSVADTIKNRSTFFEPMISDPRLIADVFVGDVTRIGITCLALVLPLFFVALGGGALQTRFNVSFKPLELKWDKLSVPAGFKRIFSLASVVRGSISIAKAIIIVAVSYWIVSSQMDKIALSGFESFQSLMFLMCRLLLLVSVAIAATMALVGIIDLAFQKWKQMQDLKMSMQDIKDEHKDAEGDPHIRARMKRLAAEIGRNQMLNDVPKADAIIRNPTHFAVAIKYDRETMDAPVVLAKGTDRLAMKIIEIAEANGVAVVERKPVARFLYFNVEIGSMIPFELYQAVAEVLNYVNKLKNAA
jgi:flagellar biosynthetic protein FlhB